MADYTRPASGFRFEFRGMKTNAAPDAIPEYKYPYAQNVRGYKDGEITSRPPLAIQQNAPASGFGPVLSLEPTMGIYKIGPQIFYANHSGPATQLDAGYSPTLGASIIPFRPSQSPNAWDYVFDDLKSSKVLIDSTGSPTVRPVGIIEPQIPLDAVVNSQIQSFMGQPAGGVFTAGGNASGLSTQNRITDTVVSVFANPTDPFNTTRSTLQVSAGASLPNGVYLNSSVTAYLYPNNHAFNGAFGFSFPLDTGTAAATATGNSLNFNPPQFNGTEDPNQQPMQWANINGSGGITGYTALPTAGGSVANSQYAMVVQAQLFVPAPGTFTIEIDHDDGMIFAIAGATLVSGPHSDSFGHTQTAVGGYKFSSGSVAGTNQSGYHKETFVVTFPSAGVYALEIDYAQWVNEQALNFFVNGNRIFLATGISSYQREMAILIAGAPFVVQDVFTPIPNSLDIVGIYYYAGNTGRCVVVPKGLNPSPGTQGESLYNAAFMGSIRRGALVQIGNEVCYVLSTSVGPDGTISFETSTVGTHTPSETLSGVPSIEILGTCAPGAAITSPDEEFSVTTGIGTITSQLSANPFVNGSVSFQEEDYLHFSVNIDNLANLSELKFLIDVGDGTFTENFYWYTVRPSDVGAAVQNTLTQLGAAELVAQRATIDEEQAAAAANQGTTSSSAQTVPGSSQWSEIMFPISALTRAGNDQTLSLNNAKAFQLLINASGALNVKFNSATVTGGFSPDVGDTGLPYMYWVRPRDSQTGARGNPSPIMRYGVSPRRQSVRIPLPTSYPAYMDTWDIFRQGGAINDVRYLGSAPFSVATTYFDDNYSDDAIAANDVMETNNFQPFPTVGPPIKAVSATVTGTALVATFNQPSVEPANAGTLSQLAKLLPGNLINVGQQVFTLWTRPTLVIQGSNTQTWLMQLVENAGVIAAPFCAIREPAIASQSNQYVWGPDPNGVLFAVGDPLRAGGVSRTNPQNPDSAGEGNFDELCAPSEPLQNGCLLGGTSVVASSKRWWAGYPQQNPAVPYRWVEIQVGKELAAPFGICTDGKRVYFWAKDGICSHSLGAAQSLTDEDLYNIFPHEGKTIGQSVSYGGQTVFPPDYSRKDNFRLAIVNGFLYADYQDATGTYRTLTYDTRRNAWCVDLVIVVAGPFATVDIPTIHAGTIGVMTDSGVVKQQLFIGDRAGQIDIEQPGANESIFAVLATREEMLGDIRADKQFGDASLDCLPAAAIGIVATPYSLNASVVGPTTVPTSAVRQLGVINLQGEQLKRSLGLLLQWIDQAGSSTLFAWQPSYIPKPEDTTNRFGDWDKAGEEGAKFFQGFLLEADTFGQDKQLAFRNGDTNTVEETFTVNFAGQQQKAFSFTNPFIAHLVRDEPDTVPWKKFGLKYTCEPTPEFVTDWITQPTSHGMPGYQHVKQMLLPYFATAAVTFKVIIDGVTYTYTLPATNAYKKVIIPFGPVKGLVFQYGGNSSAPFAVWVDDIEIWVKAWGSSGSYENVRLIGGRMGAKATI